MLFVAVALLPPSLFQLRRPCVLRPGPGTNSGPAECTEHLVGKMLGEVVSFTSLWLWFLVDAAGLLPGVRSHRPS